MLLLYEMNREVFAVVGGSNYSGGWKVYQSLEDAKKFKALISASYKLRNVNIRQLFSGNYTRERILNEMKWLASKLKKPNKIGFIYFAGHGTQVADRDGDEADGLDEALQTDDHQLVTDDELTAAFVNIHPSSTIISICDTCHSPSFDMKRLPKGVNAISIKAAQDYESALQSGDGSYMSSHLFKILAETPQIKVQQLAIKLDANMKKGFAGTMQTCKVELSNQALWKTRFI